ncbi:somatostatin receptor type 5-like isoform X2 [Convolutriloba macropyga]
MSQPTPFIQDPDPGFLDENMANGNNGNVTQDNNNSSYIQPDSSLVFITYSFVGTLGVVLNLMVIVGILVNKRMRNVPNMFILNLAVSDLLFSLGVPLIYHSTTAPKWKLGIFLCKLVNGVDALNQFTGIFIMVLMAIDRYLAIVHCMRSVNFRMRTMKGCLFSIALAWLISVLLSQPAWITATVETVKGKTMCHLAMGDYGMLWVLSSFLIGYGLPLLVITVCYGLIFFDLRKTASNTVSNVDRTTTKLVKVVIIIIFAFVLCWTPFYFSLFFLESSALPREAKQRIFELSVGAIYIHPCVNPVIFMCSSEQFQKHASTLCTKLRRSASNAEFLHGGVTCTEMITTDHTKRNKAEVNRLNSANDGTPRKNGKGERNPHSINSEC